MDLRSKALLALYYATVAGLVLRIALLDDWSWQAWALLGVFVATVPPDRVARPAPRSLALGIAFFAGLSFAVTYLPDLWFGIAYALNHAKNYLWNANSAMASIPFNDGSFLWSHRTPAV